MAVGELYRLGFNYHVHGVHCANVFHYEQTGSSSDDVPQLIQAFLDKLLPLYRNYASLEWVPHCVTAYRIKPTVGSQRIGLVPTGNEGLATGTCLPANVAAVISTYTDLVGERYRGRHYISGAPDLGETRNNHNGTSYAQLDAIAIELFADLQGTVPDGVWKLAVYSSTYGTWRKVQQTEARSPFKKLRNRTARVC